MSYVKVPVRSKYGSCKTGRATEKKKKARRKSEWDDTVNDLNVHKASPDEMARRKAAAQSNNLDLVKAELIRKQIAKAHKMSKSPGYARSKRNNALLKEVLQDESDITETLIKSDRMMAVVKDIFGDNPGKFRGLPNVTTAPEGTVPPDRKLPNGSLYSHPSKLDVLSESIMDQTALNDLDSDSEAGSDEELGQEAIAYKTSIDMERFRRCLKRAEVEEEKQKGRCQLSQRALQKTLEQTVKERGDGWMIRAGDVTPESPVPSLEVDGAMNDTGKIKKTKSFTSHGQIASEAVTATGATAGDLKQVLDKLEQTMMEYELETGRQPTQSSVSDKQQNTFSGYTTSLVTSVTKLVNYFKESEIKLKEERLVSEQLWQDIQNLKALMESMASEINYQQTEFTKLQSQFVSFKTESEMQLQTLMQVLRAHGIDLPLVQPSHRLAFQMPFPDTASVPSNVTSGAHQVNSTMNGLPKPWLQHEGQSQLLDTQGNIQPSNISAAMLLSPPKQTDSPRPNGIRNQTTNQSEGTEQLQGRVDLASEIQQGTLNFNTRSLMADHRAELQHNMQQLIQQQVQQQQQQQQQWQQQGHDGGDMYSQPPGQQAKQFNGQTSVSQQLPQHSTSQQSYADMQTLIQQQLQQQQQKEQQQQHQEQQQHDQQHQKREYVENVHQPNTNGFSAHRQPDPVCLPPAGDNTCSVPDIDEDMLQLQKQLEELNRKHELAQSKLQYIYKCHDVPTHPQPSTNLQQPSAMHNQVATSSRQLTVSPPISPIPAASEHSMQPVQPNINSKQPRMINISLPRAGVTDSTVMSPVGGPRTTTSTKMAPSTGNHAASGNRNMATKTGAKAAWFALSSHVGTS